MAAFTTIDDSEAYFQAVLYTGNGSTQSITLPGDNDLQPDLVWIKQRDGDGAHVIFDAVRGVNKYIFENYTPQEVTDEDDNLTAFNSDGFSLAADTVGYVNTNTDTYVGYNWKAGTTSSISGGDITPSAVSINTTSGVGIYAYAGTSTSGDTIAHGLGVAPGFIVCKARNVAEGMVTQHRHIGPTHYLNLDHTRAATDSSGRWNDVAPTSTVFSLGNDGGVNNSSYTYISYAFAPIQGFSSMGGYEGNGNADGPFIYTGFRPAWLLIKNADSGTAGTDTSGSHWVLYDNKRNTFNKTDTYFFSDTDVGAVTSDAEATGYDVDFLANGFKVRAATLSTNTDGNTHIYMAFAEVPFVNSSGVPCNAR